MRCRFFWFATFGGISLRIERMAANLGIQCDSNGGMPYAEVDGRQFWRLSCRDTADQWFDMVSNFPMHMCALAARWVSFMSRFQA
jgi:hypothetical protein